ncbi:MAG: sugar transferase [Candidatus Eisenbacteria bacterium]
MLILDVPALAIALALSLFLAAGALLSPLDSLARIRTLPLALSLALVPLSLTVAASFGLYRHGVLHSRRRQIEAGVRSALWSCGIALGSAFLIASDASTGLRLAVLLYHLAFALWMVGLRPVLVPLVPARHFPGEGRVVILGGGLPARDLAQGLVSRRGTVVVAFVDDQPPEIRSLHPFRIASAAQLPDLVEDLQADLLVVARPDIPREEIVRLSDALRQRGVQVKVLSHVLDRIVESAPFDTVRGLHLLQVSETEPSALALRIKRAIDVAGAGLGGLLILPFLLAVAAAIKLSSPGPVLFKQTRIGKGGQPFTFYKFRSMVVTQSPEEDEEHQRYLEEFIKNRAPAGVDLSGRKIYKLTDDPRITGVGRLLRRMSLDELPQLWNVLRGEMSLVGPRPCLPFEYDLYEEWQQRRLDVTPGMTGLWQVTGRSYVTFEDMVLLDLFYIGNWSLTLDSKLLLRTVPVILFGKGGL